jgi:hypothetical protein
MDRIPICYGYGRHSTNKQELTQEVQEFRTREYWERTLQPKGVAWGGFFYDAATSARIPFGEREQGRKIHTVAQTGLETALLAGRLHCGMECLSGCGCRSRAASLSVPERLPGRHGPVRARTSRSVGHGRERRAEGLAVRRGVPGSSGSAPA